MGKGGYNCKKQIEKHISIMTSKQTQDLLQRIEPLCDEFGITGFTCLVFSWEEDRVAFGDTGEILTYIHPDCEPDTALVLQNYAHVLQTEWEKCSIDMETLLKLDEKSYLLTVTLTPAEMHNIYCMACGTVVPLDADPPVNDIGNAFLKIYQCIHRQLTPEQHRFYDQLISAATKAYGQPSIEQGMLKGGLEGMAQQILENLQDDQLNELP